MGLSGNFFYPELQLDAVFFVTKRLKSVVVVVIVVVVVSS